MALQCVDVSSSKAESQYAQLSRWSPYMDNGGTFLACAGADFVIFACDTRMSYGYSIATRNFSRYTQLTDKVFVISCGMQSEIVSLHRQLKLHVVEFKHKHKQSPSVVALAQLLSNILYQRRFFPIYAFCAILGLEDEGNPLIYSFDAVGSFKLLSYAMAGSGAVMAAPILDTYYVECNQQIPRKFPSKGGLQELLLKSLKNISERDVTTGDFAELVCLDNSGISTKRVHLRQD